MLETDGEGERVPESVPDEVWDAERVCVVVKEAVLLGDDVAEVLAVKDRL